MAEHPAHTAEFFVELEAELRPPLHFRSSKDRKVHSIKAVKLTRNPPAAQPGSVVIKLAVEIDDRAFLRAIPEARIKVPVEHTVTAQISTEAIEQLVAQAEGADGG